jgi:hypothetical protein
MHAGCCSSAQQLLHCSLAGHLYCQSRVPELVNSAFSLLGRVHFNQKPARLMYCLRLMDCLRILV